MTGKEAEKGSKSYGFTLPHNPKGVIETGRNTIKIVPSARVLACTAAARSLFPQSQIRRRLVSEIQIKQYFTVYSSTLVDENNLLRFGDVPTLLGDTTLTLHGDDDLLSSVRLDQVEVRFADPLSLAQLPPG